uniref:Complex I-MNLL n=1 Tax=Trichuris muris TaxID=70415 RepID=A0A5S6R004_TRIMR
MGTFTFSYFAKNALRTQAYVALFVGVPAVLIYQYFTCWEERLSKYKNKSLLMSKKNIPPGEDPWKW